MLIWKKVFQRTMYFSKTLAQEPHIFLGTSEYIQLTRNSVKSLKCFFIPLKLWREISQYLILKLKDCIWIMRHTQQKCFWSKETFIVQNQFPPCWLIFSETVMTKLLFKISFFRFSMSTSTNSLNFISETFEITLTSVVVLQQRNEIEWTP